ncbi:hypothetical protein [Dinghuibacter silviterrae]|uniref:Glycosyltransferase RgtA/B/C/D-like domain-containing protein n=1 Tax=Dinghuibacter silviterrae TaxID=1539049 RepID=A0A4R8DTB0_9BACT|nr:hypothetical protein [Dinghuibacter silviterrae]TDX00655.1 hypothetical protein EDB95_1681 [Dinghuibacter silviterrae]
MGHPKRKLPLPLSWIAGLLAVKLIWALGYTYLYFSLYPKSSDAWGFFDQSRQLAYLIHTPSDFFNLALPFHGPWTDIFHYHFWNNLKQNLFVLILLGMNLVTMHNPFVDTVVYALLTFTGWVRFLRLLTSLYPGLDPWWYCVPFLLPTFLFCYSGLHPDGLVFALLGWIALDAYRLFVEGGRDGRAIARLIALILLLAILKAFLVVLLLILAAAWWLFYKKRQNGWRWLGGLTLLFFMATLPEQVTVQHQYLQLPYGHFLPVLPLSASWSGYVARLPAAAWNAFFRPAPWDMANAFYIPCGLEVWALWAIWTLGRIKRVRTTFYTDSWLFMTLAFWLLIGLTIPILSALIRYRSLMFPFVLAFSLLPLLHRKGDPVWGKKTISH